MYIYLVGSSVLKNILSSGDNFLRILRLFKNPRNYIDQFIEKISRKVREYIPAVGVALELQLLHHRASLEPYRTLVRLQTEVRDRIVARTGPHSRYVFL